MPGAPTDIPRGFVRLVYCLGYGESHLLEESAEAKNSGTPQFWKILYSCLNPIQSSETFAPVQATKTGCTPRVSNKIALLKALTERGIWLVDASILALYIPGKPKPLPPMREQLLQISWDKHVRSVLAEAAPEAVLCIGLGVANALRSRLEKLGTAWAAVELRWSNPRHACLPPGISKYSRHTAGFVTIPPIFSKSRGNPEIGFALSDHEILGTQYHRQAGRAKRLQLIPAGDHRNNQRIDE
ncbi:MAG: hypothetical protein M3Z85_02225 [Acidobacteriota bacterium]|nr:hypothetical protein [Acidobacteriota bacterium]